MNKTVLIALLIAVAIFFIVALTTLGGRSFLVELTKPETINYLLAPQYVKPSDKWQSYELSNITFQVPDNFTVKILDKYRAEIRYFDKGEGAIWIDSGVYRFLASYDEAIKYYQSDEKIKGAQIKKTFYGAFITGQRYTCSGWCDWENFTDIIVLVNNKAVLLKYFNSSKKAIDLQTFEKIAATVKPI